MARYRVRSPQFLALRMLGRLSELEGDQGSAVAYMEAAAKSSLRESDAVAWLMHTDYAQGDFAGSVRWAQTILQTRSQSTGAVLPVLAPIAENEQARAPLEALLLTNPPWRREFFEHLPPYITDARTPLRLLLQLKDTPNPPTALELRPYLDFLSAHKHYDLAYYTWLQFLPAEQFAKAGFLFNGSFEWAPDGQPFDWTIGSGSGVDVEIASSPGDPAHKSLSVEFGLGRVEFPDIEQLIVLSPGKYKLEGQFQGKIAGRRGLEWKVICVDGQIVAGESPMFLGVTPSWSPFEAQLTIPPNDCPAQHLRLELEARSASEQFVSGSAWFQDLKISRVGDKQAG